MMLSNRIRLCASSTAVWRTSSSGNAFAREALFLGEPGEPPRRREKRTRARRWMMSEPWSTRATRPVRPAPQRAAWAHSSQGGRERGRGSATWLPVG